MISFLKSDFPQDTIEDEPPQDTCLMSLGGAIMQKWERGHFVQGDKKDGDKHFRFYLVETGGNSLDEYIEHFSHLDEMRPGVVRGTDNNAYILSENKDPDIFIEEVKEELAKVGWEFVKATKPSEDSYLTYYWFKQLIEDEPPRDT
jgi:hypothetical protein